MRAYVITSHQNNKTTVIGLRSSKKLAKAECEKEAGGGKWERMEKHTGDFVGESITASYEMFYVNE